MKKRSLAFILAILLLAITCLSACGKQSGEGNDEKGNSGKVYNATYVDWLAEGYPMGMLQHNGVIYTMLSKYDEKTEVSTYSIETMNPDTQETSSIPIEIIEEGKDAYISDMCMDANGNIYVFYVMITYSNAEKTDGNSSYFLLQLDAQGKEINRISLDTIIDSKDMNIQAMKIDLEGNFYLEAIEMGGNGGKILVLSADGKKTGQAEFTDWIENMFVTKEGTVYISQYGTDGMEATSIDKNGNKGAAIKLPNFNGNLDCGNSNNLLYNRNNSLYSFDLQSNEETEILNWLSMDINSDYISSVCQLDENKFMALSVDYSKEEEKTSIIILTEGKASDVVEKKEITYGCMYADDAIKNQIIEYNKTNPEYRIVIKDYSNESDWEAGVTEFNNAISSGDIPDIIDFSSGISISTYASKGLLTDLNELIEKDDSINREDYLENVLSACEMDGKLYYFPLSFDVNTMVARASEVGTEPGWTMEEMQEYIKSKKKDDVQIFEYATKESVLYTCGLNNISRYVNWETGECSFDTQEFVDVLTFSNDFVAEKDYNYEAESESLPTLIDNHKLLFCNLYLSDVDSYQVYRKIFKNDMTMIGFPNSEGTNGAYLNIGSGQLAISTKSKYADAAWDFIKSLLTDEYQTENCRWNFPINKAAFDSKMEECMKDDEGGGSWGWGDVEIEIEACSQEEVDAVRKLIDETNTLNLYDDKISEIITEEAKPFFEGQKSAQDAAKVIQSRVQIYVNENR